MEYITVYDSLIAEFEADSTIGFAPLEVQFTDISTFSQNPITTWQWDFQNDGIIDSYLQNPSYIYSDSGSFSVSLIIGDGTNSDIEIKDNYISVLDPLNADFNVDTTMGYEQLEVQFTDISTGNIVGWMWDFQNDGVIDSNEQNPIYIYEEVGIYTVSLTITDGSVVDTEIKVDYITVAEPIIADFEANPLSGLIPLEVQFTDLSIGGLPEIMLNSKSFKKSITRDIISWEWDFDNDGFIDSNVQNPIYVYENAGIYTVSLTISDSISENTEIKEDYIEVTGTNIQNNLMPIETKLFQNHPNPFNPTTTIEYNLKETSNIQIQLFNIKGQRIVTLVNQNQAEGYHSVIWYGNDSSGHSISSGLYFFKLIVNNRVIDMKKCLLLK